MTLNKKELNKLSPEERIKRLKLMEEERKKEVNEIERLIKESMQEIKTDKLADEIAPEQKAVDISKLFETTAGEKLERTAREETRPAALMKGTKGYQAFVETYQAYSQAKELYGIALTGGGLTEEQKVAMLQIEERISTAERYMTESEKTASKLDASRVTLYRLKKLTRLG